MLSYQHIREESKSLFPLAWPIITAQLAHIAIGFVDTVMAGNLSALDLAAVAIGRSIFLPVFMISLGVIFALTPMIAQHFGGSRLAEIGSCTRHGVLVSLGLALPVMLFLQTPGWILVLMNIELEIRPVTEGYMFALSWAAPAQFAYLVLRAFHDGIGRTRPHLYITLAAIPLNVAANYVLMYGEFGFPKLGAVGTGWASTIVYWSQLGVMLLLLVRSKQRYGEFRIWHKMKSIRVDIIKEIFVVGLPNGLSLCMEVSMFAVAALVIGSMGVEMVAAHQIALNIASICFMLPLGVSLAATSRVGFLLGQRNSTGAAQAGYTGIIMGILITIMTAAVLVLAARPIIRIYTAELAVIDIAVSLLMLAAIFQLSDGIQVTAIGALRGLKDTKIPMIINFFSYWVFGLPLGIYLGVYAGMQATGLWIGMIIGLTLSAVFLAIRYRQQVHPSRIGKWMPS